MAGRRPLEVVDLAPHPHGRVAELAAEGPLDAAADLADRERAVVVEQAELGHHQQTLGEGCDSEAVSDTGSAPGDVVTEIAPGVLQIDTLLGGWERVTAGYLVDGPSPVLVETGSQTSVPALLAALGASGSAPVTCRPSS